MTKFQRTGLCAALAATALLAACSKKQEVPPVAPKKPEVPAPVVPPKPETPVAEEPKPVAEPAPEARPATVSTLAAYFHFDEERAAKSVTDSSPLKRTARLNDGVAAGAAGMVKGALDFSSSRKGQVTLFDPLDFATNTATVVAWVKRRGPQLENAALFYARGGETTAGLLVGKRGELSYVWGLEKSSEGWISGLVLPDQTWAFVALVAEADRATLYLGVPGEPLWSAENSKPHITADFSGALTIGRDPILDSGFEGSLDELGFWKNSMGHAEIEKLFLIGQKLAAASKEAAPAPTAPVARTTPATPTTKEPAVVPSTKPVSATSSWDSAEFQKTVLLYNECVTAFQKFLLTRQNPASLKHIEADVRACADTFERLKKGAPASLDMEPYLARCNKLNFDIHAAKTLVQ